MLETNALHIYIYILDYTHTYARMYIYIVGIRGYGSWYILLDRSQDHYSSPSDK